MEQYEKVAPLLALADLGKAVKTADTLKPGEIKRRELKRRAVDALREHGTIGHAAAAAGVSPSTLYRWRDQDEAFNQVVTEFLNVDLVDTLVSSMYSIATNTDPKLANAAVKAGEFLLKAYDRDTFGDQIKTEVNQTVNHMVQVVHSVRDTMREEQAAKIARLQERTITVEPSNSDGKEKE
ncbi:hypothetical protein ASF71_06870 [Deinococcus sp. Leaf326]|nr:hypothetical protein ASF71_06870 [Deinococcus sp. Leaf326]